MVIIYKSESQDFSLQLIMAAGNTYHMICISHIIFLNNWQLYACLSNRYFLFQESDFLRFLKLINVKNQFFYLVF